MCCGEFPNYRGRANTPFRPRDSWGPRRASASPAGLSGVYRGSVAGRRSIYTGLFLEFEVASEVVFADNGVGCEFLGRTVKEDFPFK